MRGLAVVLASLGERDAVRATSARATLPLRANRNRARVFARLCRSAARPRATCRNTAARRARDPAPHREATARVFARTLVSIVSSAPTAKSGALRAGTTRAARRARASDRGSRTPTPSRGPCDRGSACARWSPTPAFGARAAWLALLRQPGVFAELDDDTARTVRERAAIERSAGPVVRPPCLPCANARLVIPLRPTGTRRARGVRSSRTRRRSRGARRAPGSRRASPRRS